MIALTCGIINMFKLYCYNDFSVSYDDFKFKNTKSVAYFSVFCVFLTTYYC